MKKKTVIIFMLIFIAIIICLFLILMYNFKTIQGIGSLNAQDITNVQSLQVFPTVQTSYEEIKISPNATITFFKHYTGCNHTTRTKENISSDMVNLSQSEFANIYSDWSINKFTTSEIELSKDFNGSCQEHFLVKTNSDGYVDIYNINDDNSVVLKEKTEIAVKFLSSTDVEDLKSGVILYGKENLNAYIENFE